MPWIGFEEREILLRESLHLLRKRIVALPERSERMGLHGKGRKFPASISASIFSKAEACLPLGEKSCSNCSSQESLSCFACKQQALPVLRGSSLSPLPRFRSDSRGETSLARQSSQ